MPTFTVHVPSGIDSDVERAERTIFVREGFSLPAFLFGPFFLVFRRLWRAVLAWLVAAIVVAVLAHVLVLPTPVMLLLYLILAILVGLEANEARRQALGRRGYIGSALVTGSTRTMVERTFFAGWSSTGLATTAGRPGGVSLTSSNPAGPASRQVIGMFPQPSGGASVRRS